MPESIQKTHFNMRQPVDEMLPDVWFHDFFLFLKQHSAVPTNFFMSKLWSHESTALKSFLAKVSHWCTASFAHTISSISHNFHLISGFAWSSTQEKKMKMKSSRHFLSEWSCLKNDIDACLIYEKKDKKKDTDWKVELMAGSHIRIFFYLLELLMMNLDL